MAFIDNTTYTGQDALNFYSKALLGGATTSVISVNAGIKSKFKIPRLDLTGIVQEGSCTFSASGDTTLSQKTLAVTDFKVNLEMCVADFEANFLSEQLRAGSNNNELPAVFQDYFLNQIRISVNNDIENLIWNGVETTGSTLLDSMDGFFHKFENDSTIVDVVGTTLSESNILAEIGKLHTAIRATVLFNPNLRIMISPAAAKFYQRAIAAGTGNGGNYYIGAKELDYLGIPMIVVPNYPANYMVAAVTNNLWFGTDILSDAQDVLIIPQLDKTGSNAVRFVAQFKIGVEYGIGEEIVFYKPA